MITFCESDTYALRYDSRSGGDIVHRATQVSTPLFVGSEGFEDLGALHLTYSLRGVDAFNAACAEYFAEGMTVYNAKGEMGHMLHGHWEAD